MPRRYPVEIRRQVVELARAGTRVAQLSQTFGMTETTIYNWIKQDKIDQGELDGLSTDQIPGAGRREEADPSAGDRVGRGQEGQRDLPRPRSGPKSLFPVIDALTGQGINVRHACRVLGVSESGYYDWKDRPASPRTLRRIWLASEIVDIHKASGGTYGALRVGAELRHGRDIIVGHNAVESIMRELGLKGVPTRRLPKGARVGHQRSLDLVRRVFRREQPNQLWMTDITEHPTSEGKIYCCVVLDAFSRFVAGWALDSTQTTNLVLNALGMATRRRGPQSGLVIHSDRGVQFTSWAFSQRVRDAGIAPSMGSVGTPADNAMIESFWGRMQVELFNRRRWKTRIELASAIHDYIELWHNTRRRHSALGMLTPTEYENTYITNNKAA